GGLVALVPEQFLDSVQVHSSDRQHRGRRVPHVVRRAPPHPVPGEVTPGRPALPVRLLWTRGRVAAYPRRRERRVEHALLEVAVVQPPTARRREHWGFIGR